MTPKEKAIELVDKFNKPDTTHYPYVHNAQQCALIAVDEIILFFNNGAFKLTYLEITKYEIPYWTEVKKEIELL